MFCFPSTKSDRKQKGHKSLSLHTQSLEQTLKVDRQNEKPLTPIWNVIEYLNWWP